MQGEGESGLTAFFQDYLTVFAFGALGAGLAAALVGVASLLRPNNPNPVKSDIYECGIEPVGGGWSQTHIRYYVFALLFLIFDVEAIFIFPWAVNVAGYGWLPLVLIILFMLTVLEGLVYAVKKGVLTWE